MNMVKCNPSIAHVPKPLTPTPPYTHSPEVVQAQLIDDMQRTVGFMLAMLVLEKRLLWFPAFSRVFCIMIRFRGSTPGLTGYCTTRPQFEKNELQCATQPDGAVGVRGTTQRNESCYFQGRLCTW